MNIEDAIKTIQKAYGNEAILSLKDNPEYDVKTFSSGSTAIDIASDCGGWPRGRIVELFGPESSGKTTIMLHAIANAQRVGRCAFIDVEHSFDPRYAKAIGVDTDSMLFSQPSSAEETLNILKTLAKADGISLICVDSVAAMSTTQEIEGEIGDANISSLARLMGQQIKQITGILSLHNVTAIFSNQLREKPGVMYGNPEYQPGGKALKFHASMRCRITRESKPNQESGRDVSSNTKLKFVKNKCGRPFKEAELVIKFGEGIDDVGTVFALMIAKGVIIRKGSSFLMKYKDREVPLGIGKAAAVEKFKESEYETAKVKLVKALIRK